MVKNKEKLLRVVTILAVSNALFLVAIKAVAWMFTDSVSILSSLMDSSLDFAISGLNFIAIRYALKPPDEDHRYGHGKAEDIAALLQSGVIVAFALMVVVEAIKHIIDPHVVEATTLGIVIMSISLITTIALVGFQKYVYKKTDSNLVHADSIHYVGDILSNIAIIISLIFSVKYGWMYLDPLLGFGIAAYILWGGWNVGRKAFDHLMDKEFNDELRSEIMEIITKHDEVIKVTNLRTRKSGTKPLIQFEFTMDGSKTLRESHDIAHKIEDSLVERFPEADIFIHQEPAD